MSIQSEITRIAQNVSDSFDAVAAKGGTRPQAQNSSNLPDAILSIPAAGVQSFNGRAGDVEPQEGDYSAEMVGAQPTINVRGLLKGNGEGNVSAATPGTDYADASTINALSAKIDGTDAFTVSSTFNFRKVAGGATIRNGMAKAKNIKGNTLAWNQLVQNGNFADASGWKFNSSPSWTHTASGNVATAVPSTASCRLHRNPFDISVVVGHKYLQSVEYFGSDLASVKWQLGTTLSGNGDLTANRWNKLSWVGTVSSLNGSYYDCCLYIALASGYTATEFKVRNYQVYDLTQMFGAGNEPTTVEEALALIGSGYHAYDAGSLRNFTGDIKSVGFNAWDEEWESGNINATTGEAFPYASSIRSKNYISVIPSSSVYVKAPRTLYLRWYDGSKGYLGSVNPGSAKDNIITAPANASYLRFVDDATTYNNDICINLSQPNTAISPHNGDYVPYEAATLTIPKGFFTDGQMRSAGAVHDEVTPSKAVKRVGTVDLGTLDWHWASDISCWVTTTFPSVFRIDTSNVVSQFGYRVFANVNYNLWAYFPQSESPHGYCNYELATPIETPLTLDLTYPVTPSGTEEKVSVVPSSPVKADIEYNMALTDAVQELERGAVKMDLMWENASPTSTFSAQTIPLNLSGYRFVMVQFRDSTSSANIVNSLISNVGDAATANEYNGGYRTRAYTINSNGIVFEAASTSTYLTPVRIYGIK